MAEKGIAPGLSVIGYGIWSALGPDGPSTIAAAVHAGRRFAEEFGRPATDFLEIPFRREVTALS